MPRARPGTGRFKDYDLGFVHRDAKHLPALRTADGQVRRRYLFVAIDRCSRSVHLAVTDDLARRSAVGVRDEAVRAFPFRVATVLTDRGASVKAVVRAARATCAARGIEHRRTQPYTPQTNGMAERFNGRIQREVLTINVGSHRALEQLLLGYRTAYNLRRRRVLGGTRRPTCRPNSCDVARNSLTPTGSPPTPAR